MSRRIGTEFKKFAVKSQGISSSTLHKYDKHIENMTRSVIEERPVNFREVDVFSRLIMDRIIFLGTSIDDNISNIIVAQLLFLESVDSKKGITLYINSPGGSVYDGLAIYDTMQYIKPPVSTICTGLAASMGAVLLVGGAAGERFALPHSRVMIHQASGGMRGVSADMEITVNEIKSSQSDLFKIIASHSGRTYEEIEKDSDRDYWLRADKAKEYGLIDEVLKSH